ncbi:hypothetical protein ACSBOB_01430 [Mesorhizobium sp. ASY16-5R]|uniref:hypothetical protein n=1 Tax=Mesorhizobium sp. ASY16-5R TaxID=3445772 RepID=UPI003FA0E1FF
MRHEIPFVPIKISIPRATAAELQRGISAAMRVFKDAGVDPHMAADGRIRREAWDTGGLNSTDITDEQLSAATAWENADLAALEAACAGWDADCKPQTANLEILHDPEAQLADRPTAIQRLRKIAGSKKWTKKDEDRIATYAWIIAGDLEGLTARPLVDPITIGANRVEMAPYKGEDATAFLQTFSATVEALIEATELRT